MELPLIWLIAAVAAAVAIRALYRRTKYAAIMRKRRTSYRKVQILYYITPVKI